MGNCHLAGIAAWTRSRQTNGILDTLQRAILRRQAQGSRIRPTCYHYHSYRHRPARRQARLNPPEPFEPETLPTCNLIEHGKTLRFRRKISDRKA